MNHCDAIRERAPLYLSGEMEAEARDAFEAHVAGCPACAAMLADDRKLDATLRSALGGSPADTGRLEQSLRRKIALARRRRQWALTGVIAAVVLLTAAPVVWLRWTKAPPSYAEAARDHRTEVIEGRPRRWRSSPEELTRLAAQTGLQLPQATAMAAAGYRLERAKICRLAGQPVLHLVYSDGTRSYSVFVSPSLGRPATTRTVQQGDERIAGFETARFRALVVSNGSGAECAELARAVAKQL